MTDSPMTGPDEDRKPRLPSLYGSQWKMDSRYVCMSCGRPSYILPAEDTVRGCRTCQRITEDQTAFKKA